MNDEMLLRILGVDDEAHILSALQRTFIDEPFEFMSALSGAEGLQMMQYGHEFDVIISDFKMPGMNGVEFLKNSMQLQPQARRILLTGYAPDQEITAAISEGIISAVLAKPWDVNELIASITNIKDEDI